MIFSNIASCSPLGQIIYIIACKKGNYASDNFSQNLIKLITYGAPPPDRRQSSLGIPSCRPEPQGRLRNVELTLN